MNILNRKLSPTERRRLVALGVRARKSKRAIAKELDVDEGTVRRDSKFLTTPLEQRPVKKGRPKKVKRVLPTYDPDDAASLELHVRRVLKELKLWIEDERILFAEIEDVIDGASKLLHVRRRYLRSQIAVPTEKPKDLLLGVRPAPAPDEIIPNPDFWARWLARWLALCLPDQEELQTKVLRDTLVWARSAYSRFVYWSHV